MKLAGSVILVFFCFVTAAFPQVRETRLSDAAAGFSFAVPDKWASERNAEGFALVNPEKTVIVVVKSHNYTNFQEFGADANLARDGLELVGEPQQIENGVTFRTVKRTQQGMLIIDTCVLFSPYGTGVAIAALSDEKSANSGFERAIAIARSVQFEKPPEGASGPFAAQLKGKHLLFLYTASGYSERKDIYLCASGAFYQSNDLGGFNPNDSDDASLGIRGSAHGTWSISGNSLTLNFRSGGTTRYTLTKRSAGNEVGLNGQRFFVREQNACR
ncbi:MAG: lipocalin family protein [Pyrinomonadaceae bacterium]|nr:lipocalin family protein [Pyrinomonadaceae bacterium]